MKRDKVTTFAFSEAELALLAAYARLTGRSRSDIIHHLLANLAIKGNDFVLTGRFLALPREEQAKQIAEIVARLETD